MSALTIRYFARIRESLDCESESYPLSATQPVDAIIETLRKRGGNWEKVFSEKYLVAINHEIANGSATVQAGDELAFYPPVTGG